MDAYAALERRLGPALEANRPGSAIDHVVIALPSYSVSESLDGRLGLTAIALTPGPAIELQPGRGGGAPRTVTLTAERRLRDTWPHESTP